MTTARALALLFFAACLEVGGDALIARGLKAPGLGQGARLALCLAGGAVLLAYGVSVNLPPWDFGRLLGIYVAFFFVVAQIVSAVAMSAWPPAGIWVGGALVLAGAAVLTFWR